MATAKLGLVSHDIAGKVIGNYWDRIAEDGTENDNLTLIDNFATALDNTVRVVSMSLGTEGSQKIRVTGQVKSLLGSNVSSSLEVRVETMAVSAGSGSITVVSGTDNVTVNTAALKIQNSWITTKAGGDFIFDVEDDKAEAVLVSARVLGGVEKVVKLTFA